nr:MtrAB system histidine kinase MtrB [Naumannella cuiyingiana]
MARLPARWWWGSLPLRVIATTLLASAIVITLGGLLLMQQATEGVLSGKKQSALAEASLAYDTAQRQLAASDLDDRGISLLLLQLTTDVGNRGNLGSRYQVLVEGPVSNFVSGQASPDSVPDSLRREVDARDGLWLTPTTIRYRDATPDEPGLAIGAALVAPGAGRYPMYFLFPLAQERETIEVLRQAVITTGVMLIGLLALIAALVARQVVAPVREARKAAERLASGFLDDRMTVRGTDDLASLATSMNNMASELSKQISQLEELSRIQQQFVSDVSHELRTPLTTVRMAAELLHEAREDFDPTSRRAAELLAKELDRFEEMLSDLLEISRFDAGAAELSVTEVDMVEVVEREIAAQRAFAQRSGIDVRLHAGGPIVAEVDERRVRRVLRNLITNALEHGEGRPVDIRVAGDADAVAITVRDHGVGFEAGQVKKVFHRFWRADPARNRTIGGSGLGLAISMEDARLHGGWLNAWGRPGKGAQFRLTLPRARGRILQLSPLPLVPTDLLRPAERLALTTGRADAPAGAAPTGPVAP